MKKKQRAKYSALILVISSLLIGIPNAFTEIEYYVTKTLQSLEPDSNSNFGYCIAVNDDYIVLSEPRATADEVISAGKAYIYDPERDILVTLRSPKPWARAHFGMSLAVNEDVVVVGEPRAWIDNLMDRGYVYLFDTSGNLSTTLRSPDTRAAGLFGWSITLCGDTIFISEPGREAEGVINAGIVYKFNLDGEHLATLQSPDPSPGYSTSGQRALNFGYSIAGNDEVIVVGEPYKNIGELNQAGKAYIFDKNGNYLTTLESPEPPTLGNFGKFVAISGDILVVVESYAEVNGKSRAGRAHVFNTDGTLHHTLQAPEPEEGARFGVSVAVNDDTIVVGEYIADVLEINEGRAHVFNHDGTLISTIQSPDPGVAAEFGYSVAISGERIIVGEPGSLADGELKAGKAYIFSEEAPETVTPEVVETPTVSEPETQTDDTNGGIPGFPIYTIISGLIVTVYLIQYISRNTNPPQLHTGELNKYQDKKEL